MVNHVTHEECMQRAPMMRQKAYELTCTMMRWLRTRGFLRGTERCREVLRPFCGLAV